MPTLPQQPSLAKKSLQVNINSEDDAKAVIQHLGKIKSTFETLKDTSGIESIEFCIAESIRKKVENIVTGAVNWCRTYTKSVMPFEGNAHFPLPHFINYPNSKPARPAQEACCVPAEKPNRYLPHTQPQSQSPTLEPLGKTKRPVTADAKGA